jgi:iron-sulfur cluster assembly accessory protein
MEQDAASANSVSGQPSDGQPIVILTDQAASMLKVAMEREGAQGHGVRVGVVGGGCSGFQYHLAFEATPSAEDAVFEQAGVRIFVDPESQPHLQGVTLDYVTGLHAAGFKFINPNASRTCGCGSSFAT